jgi:uncharacterized membrane-anchored protein
MRALVTAMLALALSLVGAPAQAQITTQAQAEAFYASLNRSSGVAFNIADGRAYLSVPSNLDFVGVDDARRLALDAMGNPPDFANDLVGAFMPANTSPWSEGGWVALVKYHPVGYVHSDDASALDADRMLQQLRATEIARGGFMTIQGWAEQPYFDGQRHALFYGVEASSSNGADLNYQIWLLARDGVLEINIITRPEDLTSIRAIAPSLADAVAFNSGYRYEDFTPGDLDSHTSIAGLITGEQTQTAPSSEDIPEIQYTWQPQAPPPPAPLPSWVVPALWGTLAGFVFLYIVLFALSMRGNVPLPRDGLHEVRGVETVDLNRAVRLRESHRVVRAYFGNSMLSAGAFLYILAGLGSVGALFFFLLAPGMSQRWWGPLILVGVNVGALVLLFIYSLGQYVHRRIMATLQVIFTPLVILTNIVSIGLAGAPVDRALEHMFGARSPVAVVILCVIVFGLMIASIVMTFGWARNCWRLLTARRANFLVARGWRSPKYSFGGAVRRMLSVPTYVSALQRGRRRVMAMFVLGGVLGAGAALFPLVAPGLTAAILSGGEGQNPYLTEDQLIQLSTAALWLAPIGLVVVFLLAQLLAFLGRLASRKGQRMAASRYQTVREWDDRSPVLYLRSFTIDNQPVAVKPRGWTARLIGLGARFPTLDEAVLDCAAPYGPVIAIGDPRDPMPPLGAARTFVGGGDWQSVVSDLLAAAQLVVLTVDTTEGVQWEVRRAIEQGFAGKTLFLASPARTPEERSAGLEEVARTLGYRDRLPANAIALSPARDGLQVLTAPNASGDAYATALNLRLQQDFGLAVNFPKRPRQQQTRGPSMAGPTALVALLIGVVGAGFLAMRFAPQFANADLGVFSGAVSCTFDRSVSSSDDTLGDMTFTATGRLCVNGRTLYARAGDVYERAILSTKAHALDVLTINPSNGEFWRERYPLSDEAMAQAHQAPGDSSSGLGCDESSGLDAVQQRNAALMALAEGQPAQRFIWRCVHQ